VHERHHVHERRLHHVHERCVRHSVSGATPLEIAMPFQTRIPSNTMERSQGCQNQHLLSPLSLFARGASFSEDAYCPFALDALRQSLELLRELFLDEPVSHELVRTMWKNMDRTILSPLKLQPNAHLWMIALSSFPRLLQKVTLAWGSETIPVANHARNSDRSPRS